MNSVQAMKRRPLTSEEFQMKRQEFLTAAEPFLQAKCDVYAYSLPDMTLYPDGRMEVNHRLSAEQQKTLDLLDEAIKHLELVIYGKPTCGS